MEAKQSKKVGRQNCQLQTAKNKEVRPHSTVNTHKHTHTHGHIYACTYGILSFVSNPKRQNRGKRISNGDGKAICGNTLTKKKKAREIERDREKEREREREKEENSHLHKGSVIFLTTPMTGLDKRTCTKKKRKETARIARSLSTLWAPPPKHTHSLTPSQHIYTHMCELM